MQIPVDGSTSRLAAALWFSLVLASIIPCWGDTAQSESLATSKPNDASPRKPLRIVSQGGAYQQSQALAFFEPFRAEHGIPIEISKRTQAILTSDTAAAFDVIDLPAGEAARACREGVLEKVDVAALLGDDARKDFIAGALSECAIGSTVWSAFFVYNRRAFVDRRLPTSIADVFDPARHPGKRVFPRAPRYLLEAALLADQVAPSQVYKTLETPAGVTRAFQKLDRLKAQMIWFDRPAEAIALLRAPDTAFAMTFSGRAFTAAVQDRLPLNILWNAQIYDVNVWAIAKNSTRLFDARDFIKFAMDPRRLASQTRWFPYGPARVSAAAFVGRNADIDMDMAPWLPTTPANFKNALAYDASFWASHEATLTDRFNAWADGKIDAAGAIPLPKPDPNLKGKALVKLR